ncbi:MAG: DUF6531 domain-containing protein [Lentisphaerae bacterium]|nr:DUF6531 domain-containing protein [Lentisphaerota bacterium]
MKSYGSSTRILSGLLSVVLFFQTMPMGVWAAVAGSANPHDTAAGQPLPVDLRTGELVLGSEDLRVGIDSLPLAVSRAYRSGMAVPQPGVFGWKWHSVLDMAVTPGPEKASLVDEAGRNRQYRLQPDGRFVSEKYDYETIRPEGDGFVRELKTGVTYHFDHTYRLTEIRDRNGRHLTITRAETGAEKTIRLEDRYGRSITLWLNSDGRAIRMLDCAGRMCLYGYDTQQNLTAFQSRAGGVVMYQYDAAHRLINIRGAGGSRYEIQYKGERIAAQYRVIEGRRARLAEYRYDEGKAGLEVAVTDALRATSHAAYGNDDGRVAVTDPTGVQETIWLNERELPVKAVGADGRTAAIAYDAHANVVSVGVNSAQTQFTYGPDDALQTMTAATGESVSLAYDGRRNVTAVSNARGARTQFTWNILGQLVGVLGATGEAVTLAYDANGHVRSVTTADGQQMGYDFTLLGILRGVTTPTGVQIRYQYDPLDRLTGVENSEGQRAYLVRDGLGQVIKVVDPAGNETGMEYDAAGLLTAVQDPLGAVTRLAYDPLGRPTALTDAIANVTQWTYDSAGRVLSEVDALGKPKVAQYNAQGQLQAQTNRRGQKTAFSYDRQGRLIATDLNGDPATFAYDPAGRLVGMKDSDSDYRFAFTADGLLQTVTDGIIGAPVSYEYDAAGRRVKMMAGVDAVRYAYDAHGRLSAIESAVGKVAFEYDQFGRRSAMLYPNGVNTTYSYDKLNRLTDLRATGKDGQELARYQYVYDLLGNRTRMTEGADKVTQYTYDALGRLTTVAEGTNVTAYAYDAVGNRVVETANGVKADYATGKDNQLLKAGAASFAYDADGNLVSRSTADGAAYTYQYDAANRMIAASGPSGSATYGYAPNGARVSRAEADKPATRFLFDQEAVIAEISGNAQSASYLHGPGIDEPLAQTRGDATTFYQADGLGSITGLTDAQGAQVAHYTYDAFGTPKETASTVENPYRYTGREWDGTAGSYFYRARFFNPNAGRFLTKDPVGLSQGPNQYAYCANDSVNFVDPSGLMSVRALGILKNTAGLLKEYENSREYVKAIPEFQMPLGIMQAVQTGAMIGDVAGETIDDIHNDIRDFSWSMKDGNAPSWAVGLSRSMDVVSLGLDVATDVTCGIAAALLNFIPTAIGKSTGVPVSLLLYSYEVASGRSTTVHGANVKNAILSGKAYIESVATWIGTGIRNGISGPPAGSVGHYSGMSDSTVAYYGPPQTLGKAPDAGAIPGGLFGADVDRDGAPDLVDNDLDNDGIQNWADPDWPGYDPDGDGKPNEPPPTIDTNGARKAIEDSARSGRESAEKSATTGRDAVEKAAAEGRAVIYGAGK